MLKKILIIVTSFFIYSCDNNNNDDLILSCNDLNIISELDDFNLEDLNPNSNTFGEFISLNYFIDSVRLFYFSNNETWTTCISRFGSLNALQQEYIGNNESVIVIGIGANNNTPIDDMILGVNLPLLKDNSSNNIWNNWDINNRDLIILSKEGEYVLKINLSSSFNEHYIRNAIDCLLIE